MDLKLTNPPSDARDRELWLQHAAGFIIFRDIRAYAIDRIPVETDQETKGKLINAIDDTVYGLMMMMDGVTGKLQNEEYAVSVESNVILESGDKIIEKINTLDGDEMCMGFHGWKEGDFGDDDIYTT